MKKLFSIFGVLLAFACTFTFLGCDELEITAPTQKWCEKDFTYDDSTVTVHFYYTESDVDITSNTKYSDTFKKSMLVDDDSSKSVLPAGLTLVADCSSGSAALSALADNKYAVLTLKAGSSYTEDGEVSESGKFKMSETLWSAIYILNYSSISGSASSSVPSSIKINSKYTELTDTSSFSWKKIIAQILIDKLLE